MTRARYLLHIKQRQVSYSGLTGFISEQFKVLVKENTFGLEGWKSKHHFIASRISGFIEPD